MKRTTSLIAAILGAALASSAWGQSSPEITVYNQGFALVKESRVLNLKAGVQKLAFEDVAAQIESDSVSIRSISAPGSFSILEQNYQYDLISPTAILMKAIGSKITLNRVLPNGQKEVVRGTLLSAPGAIATGDGGYMYTGMVLKADDGRVILSPSGEISVDELPGGLISKPTLMWLLDSQRAGSNTVEMSYITGGMAWRTSYVINLEQNGLNGDFKGWVTLTNNSGRTYENAKLKLLAGEVERASDSFGRGGAGAPRAQLQKAANAGFAEEQFSDYHLYTLGRPTTVANNEMKQVSLLEAAGMKVTKRLVLDPMLNYQGWRSQEGEVGTGTIKPQIRIEFQNKKENQLGIPLPMGTIKVFQRDSSGSLQLLGEDRIDHTPKDEKVSLVVGRAFDVVAERKRTKFSYIYRSADKGQGPIGARESFEIEIRNRKETSETVDLIERYWGDWKVTANSDPFTKLDADSMLFKIVLKPNEVRKVTFTVENRWAQ